MQVKLANTNTIMFCPQCGKEIPTGHTQCLQCGYLPAEVPRVVYMPQAQEKTGCGVKIAYTLLLMFGLSVFAGIIRTIDESGTQKKTDAAATSATVLAAKSQPAPEEEVARAPEPPPVSARYVGDCGIQATAHMSSDIINHPQLKISIRNTSGKNIAAIRFLAIPYDVYGEEIKSYMFTQEHLYTDDLIAAGKRKTITYGPFLLQNIKKVKLFVYSVYNEDGTEWGDKEASRSEIIQYGKPIEATFEK